MDTNWLGKFVDVTVLLEPVNSGSVRTESKVLVVPGTLNVFRMNALTSFASPGEVAGCAFAATAEITTPATSAPVGVTDAPLAAAAAVVPCWPRVTAHVVFPTPLTPVTRRISEPMTTEKFGCGNPAPFTTVLDVCTASMRADNVVLAESSVMTADCTALNVDAIFACVICVVVAHPPVVVEEGGVSR